jgi:hypothetical protein
MKINVYSCRHPVQAVLWICEGDLDLGRFKEASPCFTVVQHIAVEPSLRDHKATLVVNMPWDQDLVDSIETAAECLGE